MSTDTPEIHVHHVRSVLAADPSMPEPVLYVEPDGRTLELANLNSYLALTPESRRHIVVTYDQAVDDIGNEPDDDEIRAYLPTLRQWIEASITRLDERDAQQAQIEEEIEEAREADRAAEAAYQRGNRA